MTVPDLPSMRFTLCFLTRADQVLMLLRNRPPNQGLWNGVGGHLEPGESPLAGILREVREETGFNLSAARFAGVLTWQGFEIDDGGLYIFTAEAPAGEPALCSEGEIAWKPRPWVFTSPQVVSNIHRFAPLALNGAPPQRYHFVYRAGQIQSYQIYPLPEGMDGAQSVLLNGKEG